MERPTVKLDKNSQERRAARTKVLFIVLLIGIAVLAGLIAFFRQPSFQVGDISVQGAKSIDAEQVRSEAQKFLKGNRLVVIPRSNVLLISKRAVERHLLEQLPSLTHARVAFANRTSLIVTVTEKKPDYVWCTTGNACYFVDDAGTVFSDAPTFSNGVYVTLRGGNVSADQPIKATFADAETFDRIKAMLTNLRLTSVDVYGVELRDNGDLAFHIGSLNGVRVGSASYLLSVKTTDPQDLIDNLQLILKDSAFSDHLQAKGVLLEYLDLRFPGKIYYKFSDQ